MSDRVDVEEFIKDLRKKTLKDIFSGITIVNANESFNDREDTKYFDAISFYKKFNYKELMEFASGSKINHILNLDDPIVEKHIVISILMNMYPNLFKDDPFSAMTSVYLADDSDIYDFLVKGEADFPDEDSSFSISFCSSSEKEDVINEVDAALNDIPGASRHRDEIVLMVDELFTNALYNAPTTIMGNISKDRKNVVVLDSGREAVIQVAYDKKLKRVFIGCTDLFGTLSPDELIDRIAQTYDVGLESSISFSTNGAGIGVRLLFEKSESMSICVQKEEKSCLIFSINLGLKKGELSRKTLHLLQE